jgi:carboxypeptidase C (cathepsin A)
MQLYGWPSSEEWPFPMAARNICAIKNPSSWVSLTKMGWIDQPSGAGFSPWPSTNQFNDFWKRFVNAFDLNQRKGI